MQLPWLPGQPHEPALTVITSVSVETKAQLLTYVSSNKAEKDEDDEKFLHPAVQFNVE